MYGIINEYLGSEEIERPRGLDNRVGGDSVAIRMCAIASYARKDRIGYYLENSKTKWRLVWRPVYNGEGTHCYIAFNGFQYSVVITSKPFDYNLDSFHDWSMNYLKCLDLAPWPYTRFPDKGPLVGRGLLEQLEALKELKDENGVGLYDFLVENAIPDNYSINCTGWSAGGSLAVVLASFLKFELRAKKHRLPKIVSVLSFGGPQSWNRAFCEEYDKNFRINGWRFDNMLDPIHLIAVNFDIFGYLSSYLDPKEMMISSYQTFDEYCTKMGDLSVEEEKRKRTYFYETHLKRGTIDINHERLGSRGETRDMSTLEKWWCNCESQHELKRYIRLLPSMWKLDDLFKDYETRYDKKWWQFRKKGWEVNDPC
ncbi:MAG: hypothetical protein QNK23_05485 [Crocinitomicaceae bacterium]|nr:hypothetical protein [Crocinitomicaceae bacterium]